MDYLLYSGLLPRLVTNSLDTPRQRYIVRYGISSGANKPLHGALHNAVFNTFRRVKSQALYVIVPVSIYYYIWTSSSEYNRWLYTKDGRETLERLNAE